MDTGQIRQFKLLNGDDIIAVLVAKNADSYIVESPLALVNNVTGNYHLTKWFPLSPQKSFKLFHSRIIQHVPVHEEIAEAYVEEIVNDRSKAPLVQTYQELLEDLIEINRDITDNDDEPELTPKTKTTTIH
jgi:hypothetical protein